MIQAHHNKYQQSMNSFSSNEELGEVVDVLYKKVHGYYIKDKNARAAINTALNFSIDDTLETIDRIRSPLAEKRLEGEPLTEFEGKYLQILDSLTERILSLLTQGPEESAEVRLALEHAKRVAR